MIPEVGRFALILGLMIALAQSTIPLIGTQRRSAQLMLFGDVAARVQFILVATAFSCLVYLFVVSDFSVALVAANSHTDKPMLYKIAAAWGNHEGSMLLWCLILALFGATIATFGERIPETLRARTLAVQGMLGAAFLSFVLFTSDPFLRLYPVPVQGTGLNPLLEDPGLAFHPPFLYLGYVGFSTAFSFAAAALLEGRLESEWARYMRPWVLAAWALLTIGIAGGSFWAYYELGWGGWWGWDPVENASLMPWLLGTALLHSVLVVERRRAFVKWTLLLAVLTFSLSLVGTFVVRSGVLSSVHAFALDPARGVFILGILIASTGGALALYAWRSPRLEGGQPFDLVSRETSLLLNNVLLITLTGTTFVGTFYPLFIDLMSSDKISVGAPYFARTFVPLALPLLIVMAVGPLLKWRGEQIVSAIKKLRGSVIAAALAACLVLLLRRGVGSALGIALATWIIAGSVEILLTRVRAGILPWRDSLRMAFSLPRTSYGVILAHIGMGVFVIGVTGATAWKEEAVAAMRPGDVAHFAGYEFSLLAIEPVQEPTYNAVRARISASREGGTPRTFAPELRYHPQRQMQTTEAAIYSGAFTNLYVSIGEQDAQNRWSVRFYSHPFVTWIWAGAFLMVFGGIMAWSTGRISALVSARERSAAAAVPAG